jgi:hypothetical protein
VHCCAGHAKLTERYYHGNPEEQGKNDHQSIYKLNHYDIKIKHHQKVLFKQSTETKHSKITTIQQATYHEMFPFRG